MIRDRPAHVLAACLAGLAGYVDAVGFIETHGFFVSFMTGNITRLGVGAIEQTSVVLVAAGLIAAFVVGVMLGAIAGELAGRRRTIAVLGLVTLLVAAAAAADTAGRLAPMVAMLTLAMGAVNAVFDPDGSVKVGLTYMTGTLVKLGQSFSAALLGRPNRRWVLHLAMWVSLAVGAVLGALVHLQAGHASLWVAAAFAAMLTLAAAIAGRDPPTA